MNDIKYILDYIDFKSNWCIGAVRVMDEYRFYVSRWLVKGSSHNDDLLSYIIVLYEEYPYNEQR